MRMGDDREKGTILTWICSVTLRSLSSDMDCFGWRFDMLVHFSKRIWFCWVVYCNLYVDTMELEEISVHCFDGDDSSRRCRSSLVIGGH